MTIYTDNFNRADANPLDGPWVKPTGVTLNFALSSNAVSGVTSRGARFVYYSAPTGPEQFSVAKFPSITDGDVGVACRVQPGAFSGYSFANRTVANGGWLMERYDAGTPMAIASNAAAGGADGDEVMIVARKSVISAYVNGVLALSATDATYPTGFVGLWCFNTTSTIKPWGGGDIAQLSDVDFSAFAKIPFSSGPKGYLL